MARATSSRIAAALLAVAALVGAGCAKRISVPRPAGECVLAVEGDRFLCDGRTWATLERHFCRSGDESCFGLAVVYGDGERAWLYRGRDWEGATVRGEYRPIGDTEGKLGGAYRIRLEADGRVRFELPLRPGTCDYDLAEGVLRCR